MPMSGMASCWGLWVWFTAGFGVVFAGMLVGVHTLAMLPSGRGLVLCRLWEYYVIELPRMVGPTETLGPASGSSEAVMMTALQHVVLSAVGGGAMLGLGWVIRRGRRRR